MIGPELRVALKGYDTSTLLERSRHHQQYIQENILEQVPIDSAKVNLSTSCPFYFLYVAIDYLLQFEDVADEVMQEQANTERTKTERTDQETKHTSHTQHTMPARFP